MCSHRSARAPPPHASGGGSSPPAAEQAWLVDMGEEGDISGWNWTGSDEFTPLDDRQDAPPLPLPRLAHSR